MQIPRRGIGAAAGACWAGCATLVADDHLGQLRAVPWERTFGLLLGAAVTLSVWAVLRRYVFDPRAAYRLGWDARGRHDGMECARAEGLNEERRA